MFLLYKAEENGETIGSFWKWQEPSAGPFRLRDKWSNASIWGRFGTYPSLLLLSSDLWVDLGWESSLGQGSAASCWWDFECHIFALYFSPGGVTVHLSQQVALCSLRVLGNVDTAANKADLVWSLSLCSPQSGRLQQLANFSKSHFPL